MSMDVAEENAELELTEQPTTDIDYHGFNDLTTEHIIIGTETADKTQDPTVIRQREYLNNRIQRTITEVTFYEEGFLKIREGSRKNMLKEHVLELRFIDPKPITVRQVAMPWLWLSISLVLSALLASFVMPDTQLAKYLIPTSTSLTALSVLMISIFVYRYKIVHQFHTASGKADVVSLTGSIGCFRRARTMALQIQNSIERACAGTGVHDVRYLRAEMQAHYKLAETGVITREECSDGTALILSKFG